MLYFVGFLFYFVGVSVSQLGGFEGPCSASPINSNSLVPINIYSTNINAQPVDYGCVDRAQVSGTTWFSVQTESGVRMNLTTCSTYTDLDTVISLFYGPCSSPTCYTYNDDSNCDVGNGDRASFISWISNGDVYFIGVTGYNANEGMLKIIYVIINSNLFFLFVCR